jgi:hypothetical protein
MGGRDVRHGGEGATAAAGGRRAVEGVDSVEM